MSDMKIIKLTSDGTYILDKDYIRPGSDLPKSAISASDGNIVIAGFSNSFSNKNRAWLTKINWDGDLIWENTIGRKNEHIYLYGPNTIFEDTNKNLLLAAESSGDMYAIKTNNEGKLIWDKTLNSDETIGSFDGARSIIELSNGEIILIGRKEDEENTSLSGASSDIWIVKLKEN